MISGRCRRRQYCRKGTRSQRVDVARTIDLTHGQRLRSRPLVTSLDCLSPREGQTDTLTLVNLFL